MDIKKESYLKKKSDEAYDKLDLADRIEKKKMLLEEKKLDVLLADEVLSREVMKFGSNAAHITGISPKHIGKVAKVIISKKEEDKK